MGRNVVRSTENYHDPGGVVAEEELPWRWGDPVNIWNIKTKLNLKAENINGRKSWMKYAKMMNMIVFNT